VVESAPLLYKKALVSVYRLTVEFENPARPNRTTFLGKHTQHLYKKKKKSFFFLLLFICFVGEEEDEGGPPL
jgi:hypothetical protein